MSLKNTPGWIKALAVMVGLAGLVFAIAELTTGPVKADVANIGKHLEKHVDDADKHMSGALILEKLGRLGDAVERLERRFGTLPAGDRE